MADSNTAPDYSKDLSQDNPLPGQHYFDKSIDTTLIPQQADRDVKGILSYGLGEGPDLGGNAPLHGDDPMVKALGQRYQTQTDTALRGLKQNIDVNAPVNQAKQDTTTAGEMAAEYNNQVQNFQQQYAYQVQRYNMYNQYQTALNNASSSLIGAILGGIGSIGGAVVGGLVGGPGGAAAGAIAGGKL